MNSRQVLEYYSRGDVQQMIVKCAERREVAGVFSSGAFSQRPGMIGYPADIVSMARGGAVELHCSVERWSQPMALRADNYGQLRTGWDFIVDLDCNDFRHGRAAAIVFCRAIEKHGITGYSVKFTGGTGFHIGVPWESMPKNVNYKSSSSLFPELPRAMCAYLRDYCSDEMERALLKLDTPENLAEQAGVKLGELLTKDGINYTKLVDIDSVLISPRHLFRMPYSLNAKSMLASLPVRLSELPSFERNDARPGSLSAKLGFLDSGSDGEAAALVAEALDWDAKKRKKHETGRGRRLESFSEPVSADDFPPCMKRILAGLQDGRKRSLFILVNFLSTVGWKWDAIEQAVTEWNAKNIPPLPENLIRTHIRRSSGMAGAQGRSLMPPGCDNEGWYGSIGVCDPDGICGGAAKTVKNPVGYPRRKLGRESLERSRTARQPKGAAGRRRRVSNNTRQG